MKMGSKHFLLTIALAVLALVAPHTSSAQSPCSITVPNYSPDFSSNQACLALNGEDHASQSAAYPSFQTAIPPAPPNVSSVLRLTPNLTVEGAPAYYQGGSAWFQTPQPVASPFTTTFTFQLNPASGADGIAFVIQNADVGLTALGPTGCGEGFASDVASPPGCTPISTNSETQYGITNSIAFRFDSYSQGVDSNDTGTQTNDPGVNNVTIQSCPSMAANSITKACQLAVYPFSQVAFADGNVHTATITYVLTPTASQKACSGPCLDVTLDGTDLFPNGVQFDMTTLGLNSNNAYVGFTGATGGVTDNQDILSWVFTPQGQTQTLQPGVPVTYTFQNPQGQTAFSYLATLNSGSPTTTTVTPIYSGNCDTLVQSTYPGAHCVIYTNLGTGVPDSPVMFEVTCPDLSGDSCNPFDAQLGTSYVLSPLDFGTNALNSCVNNNSCTGPVNDPFPGWLKGAGPDPAHPCTPPQSGSLFQSNQIDSFTVDTTTHGKSGGTGSCWVATYDIPQCTSPNQMNCEALPGITITAPTNNLIVAAGAVVPTNYSCSNPSSSQASTNATGPYLTTTSCTQSIGTSTCSPPSSNGISCTGSFTAPSQPGTYQFTITGTDSGENGSQQSVTYTVVAPTNLQILNIGPPGPVVTGKYITYVIGVADLGPANADGVVVTDPLPSNTTFVSGSGSNITCAIVNKKLSCSTTPITCSANGNTVSCNVGMLAPLSISSLNGGAMTIKVQVTGQPATMCGSKPCTINTASVGGINTDTNGNPTSTVKTIW